jgi:hypothetical protein
MDLAPETIRPRFRRGRFSNYFLARAFLAFFAFFAFLAMVALVCCRDARIRAVTRNLCPIRPALSYCFHRKSGRREFPQTTTEGSSSAERRPDRCINTFEVAASAEYF